MTVAAMLGSVVSSVKGHDAQQPAMPLEQLDVQLTVLEPHHGVIHAGLALFEI
jgi:hypothetical protein